MDIIIEYNSSAYYFGCNTAFHSQRQKCEIILFGHIFLAICAYLHTVFWTCNIQILQSVMHVYSLATYNRHIKLDKNIHIDLRNV